MGSDVVCLQSNEDFHFRLLQQSDLNEYFIQVTGYIILEVCFSTGTQVELSRIGHNFAKANNWRWYPWSCPTSAGQLQAVSGETGIPLGMQRQTMSNPRAMVRKDSVMINPDELADSVAVPLVDPHGQAEGGLGSGGEVKDEGNPNYYVADGMTMLRMDLTSMWPLIGSFNRTSVVSPYDRCGWPKPGQEMKHPGWLRSLWMAVWFLITLDMLPGACPTCCYS